MENFAKTFKQLDFVVHRSDNPTFDELKNLLENSANTFTDSTMNDCAACVILSSNGGEENVIKTSDNKIFSLDLLYQPFTKSNFINTPKLFFIQTYRNKEFISKEENTAFIKTNENSMSYEKLNMLRFYSVFYNSHLYGSRLTFRGTLVISRLCESLRNFKKEPFRGAMARLTRRANIILNREYGDRGQVKFWVSNFDDFRKEINAFN